MIPIKIETDFIVSIYQTHSNRIFALGFENLYILVMPEPHLNALGFYQVIDEDNFENKCFRVFNINKRPITSSQLKDCFQNIGQTIAVFKKVLT